MIEFLYDLFYMLPLDIALILSIFGVGLGNSIFASNADGTSMQPIAGCIVSGLFIILFLTLRHFDKKKRFFVGGVFAAAIASLFLILGKEKREILYDKYNWIIAILIISIIAIVVGYIAEDFTIIKIVVSVNLLSCVIYMMLSKAQCPNGTIGFSLSVIMIYLVEIIQHYWDKSGYTDVKNHVARIAPIIMIIAIITTYIPAPVGKFDWKFAKNIWNATVTEYKRVVGLITTGGEEYGYAGFSDAGNLGAGISENGREVMFISSNGSSFDRLYMGGIIYEKFDGHKWKTSLNKESMTREFDYVETATAISKFNKGYEYKYIKNSYITVENRLLNTKYVFIPSKINMLSGKSSIPKHVAMESEILASEKMQYGDKYKINYMFINYANPDFAHMIDIAQPIEEDEWSEALIKNGYKDNKNISYKKYLNYRNEIYKKYGGTTKLTMEEALEKSHLSNELKTLVRDVFEKAQKENNSEPMGDYEKLSALSDYLRTMKYSRRPGALPTELDSEESYLDYFLLKSQCGYCVHYATAFTLLARQLGYPARYVQGYYVKKNQDGTLVTEDQAHAWAEVYFDNFGWVTFESTPGYIVSKGWTTQGMDVNANEVHNDISLSDKDSNNVIEQEEEANYTHTLYIIIPVVCAIFFGMIYLLIARIVVQSKYRKMNEEEKVRIMINRNMRILRILGYPFGECMTVEEYIDEIEKGAELTDSITFLELYEKILYSNYEVNTKDVESVERDYVVLENSLREKSLFRFLCNEIFGL